MALRSMTVGVINITVEPEHTPQRYVELFDLLKRINTRGTIQKNERLELVSIKRDDERKAISGKFVRYTLIDASAYWWDREKKALVEGENGEPVALVPSKFAPNAHYIDFIMYYNEHRLVFDCKYITPGHMEKSLSNLLSDYRITDQFGFVTANYEKSRDGIGEIINLYKKERINIKFDMPNGDQISDEEESILEDFRKMNLREVEQTYKGGIDGLEVTPHMKAMFNLSLSNGRISASGTDCEGKKKKVSTDEYPLILKDSIPKKANPEKFFSLLADRIVSMIRA